MDAANGVVVGSQVVEFAEPESLGIERIAGWLSM
jgi:tryptophan synthase alpha subunit